MHNIFKKVQRISHQSIQINRLHVISPGTSVRTAETAKIHPQEKSVSHIS